MGGVLAVLESALAWVADGLARIPVASDVLYFVIYPPDGSRIGLIEQLFYDWLALDLLGRSFIAVVIIGFPTTFVFEGLKYGWLLGKRGMVHLAPIAARGALPTELGTSTVALSLQAELNSVTETLSSVLGRRPAPYLAPASGRNTGYYLVGLRQEVPFPAALREEHQIKKIEQEISLEIGKTTLPVSAVINFCLDLLGAVFVPFRTRYKNSLIRVSLITSGEETTLTTHLRGRYAGSLPRWWELTIPRRVWAVVREPLRWLTRPSPTPDSERHKSPVFTVTKPTGTLNEFNDVLRDAAFMILKLHGSFGDRDWRSMRLLLDGLGALDEYRRSGKSEHSRRADECFRLAAAADPTNVEALYFHGVMTMVARTAASIDEAIRDFERAVDSPMPQLRALVHTGLAYCYAQQAHRLGKRTDKILMLADAHAQDAEWEWRLSQIAGDDAPTCVVCRHVRRLLRADESWEGTPAQLLQQLDPDAQNHEAANGLPTTPRALIHQLDLAGPKLHDLGIDVRLERAGTWFANLLRPRSGARITIRQSSLSREAHLRPHPLIPYTYALVSMVNEEDEDDHMGRSREERLIRGAVLSRRAAELEPDNGMFYNNAGWALLKLIEYGRETLSTSESELLREPTRTLDIPEWVHDPDWGEVRLPNGDASDSDTSELYHMSERYLQHALSLNPNNKLTHANLCLLYSTEHYRTADADRFRSQSLYHGLKALELDPYYINAARDMALVLIRYGDLDRAYTYYTRALELAEDPDKDQEIRQDVVSELQRHAASWKDRPGELDRWKSPDPYLFEPRAAVWTPTSVLSDLEKVTILPGDERFASLMMGELLSEQPLTLFVVFGESGDAETLARRADRVARLGSQRAVVWARRQEAIRKILLSLKAHPSVEMALRGARACAISVDNTIRDVIEDSEPVPDRSRIALAYDRAEGRD